MRSLDFYEGLDGRPCPPAKDLAIGWHIMAVFCFLATAIRNFSQRTFPRFN